MAALGRVRIAPRSDRTPLRQFAALFVVALALLVARDVPAVSAARTLIASALVPVERALAQVGVSIDGFATAIGEIGRLQADNARLRAEVDRLTLENTRLAERAIAAEQAAKLDGAARAIPYDTVAAPVIARDPTGIVRSIVVGAGADAGVRVGHIVISDQGVVGRVVEVGPSYSKVLLLTDPASTVSAMIQGSRAAGLVRGQYGDTLVMDWILQSETAKVGDVVMTAGLAQGGDVRSLYPKGLVIGRVAGLERAEDSAYKRAIVLPAVELRRLEQVLVVKTF